MGGKLYTIIRADMIRWAMPLERFGEHRQNVIALQLALNMDRQALSAVLVDHSEHAERLPVMHAIHHEVVALDVTGILQFQPDAGTVVKPQPPALGLLLRHLEPFTTPDQLDPFRVHLPAVIAQQRCDPAIAIPAMLLGQPDDRSCQRFLICWRHRQLTLSRALLANDPGGTALGATQCLLHMINGQPTL